MPKTINVSAKICGLTSAEAVEAAVKGGAAYVGFIFFPPSPRNLSPEQAGKLAQDVPEHIAKVGVFVDPTNIEIELVTSRASLDILQLHGNETPERVAEIRQKFGLKVMKAIAVSSAADILHAKSYENIADLLLFDAKPPKSMAGALPGGNGLVFDWTLLGAYQWHCPWMLSGGLDVGTLGEAIKISGAKIIDVSSGVETSPGQKSPALITAFLAAVRLL
jgi:phosphoribosylanthranilate isomerase